MSYVYDTDSSSIIYIPEDLSDTVSGNDLMSDFVSDPVPLFTQDVSGGDFVADVPFSSPVSMSYDDLIDAYSAVSIPNVYISSSAIDVFRDVLSVMDSGVSYICVPGSDNYTAYMYYSDSASVSGNKLTLTGDVTLCTYSRYRYSTSSSWEYRYTVTTVGDVSFSPTTQLVYTNRLEGYPDFHPYESSFIPTILAGSLVVVIVSVLIGIHRVFR